MTTQLTNTDYQTLSTLIFNSNDTIIEVELVKGDTTLFVELEYITETVDTIGGSYEGYDFEQCSMTINEYYRITQCECRNESNEVVPTNFDENELYKRIN